MRNKFPAWMGCSARAAGWTLCRWSVNSRQGPHPEPLYHLPESRRPSARDEHEAMRAQRGRCQRLSQSGGRLPPPVRVLRHPAHQRHGSLAVRWRRSWTKRVACAIWACAS
ncbi:MAG: hypothetical protein M0C28_36735 [Candidatus Moduliflexus flocculans]|nr:hypothetical protein [Candidatus Moduliflexus flocculans]